MACTVPGCESRVGVLTEKNTNLSFHRFPSDLDLKKSWIKNINKGDEWSPSQHTRICSLHFEDSCFEEHYILTLCRRYFQTNHYRSNPMSHKLADKDIEQLLAALEDGNISEGGLEDESEDEETVFANARQIIQELEDEDAEDHEDPTYSDPSLVQDLPGPSSQTIISLPMQEGIQQYVEFDKRKLIWKKDSLLFDESKIIHQPNTTDSAITELDTPYKLKPADEPDLGITNNVVIRLARAIPRMNNHIVLECQYERTLGNCSTDINKRIPVNFLNSPTVVVKDTEGFFCTAYKLVSSTIF